jgi:hypothetical protein
VHPNQLKRRCVAKTGRHLGRADDIGEHHRTQPGIDRRGHGIRIHFRIADAAKERLDQGEVDRDDVGRDLSMRLTVNALGGRRIGCLNQAEIGATIAIEPVSHVFDPVPILDIEVLVVRRRNVLRGHAVHVVTIDEDWHTNSLRP